MALKLDSRQVTTAIATFAGVMYLAKSLWMMFSPNSFVALVSWVMPHLNVANVLITDINMGSMIAGLIGHVIVAWVAAYIFVYVWNSSHTWFRMGGGRKRKR